jgi:5-formyltetrahydrofolate cyclo-ligase
MDEKEALRTSLRQKRRALPAHQRDVWSQRICHHLEAWLDQREVDRVFAYRSFRDEVSINRLVDRISLRYVVGLPVAYENRQMVFYRYQEGDELLRSPWGIEEPKKRQQPLAVTEQSVILVPALAISEAGQRLGYGGGYYDSFLGKLPFGSKVGLIYGCFWGHPLPSEPHDVPVDFVCHEEGIQTIGR